MHDKYENRKKEKEIGRKEVSKQESEGKRKEGIVLKMNEEDK